MKKIAAASLMLSLAAAAPAHAFEHIGTHNYGTRVLEDPSYDVTLLGYFRLRYLDDDHHVRTIGVMSDEGWKQTTVTLRDWNNDDDIAYSVKEHIAPSGIRNGTYYIGSSTTCGSRGVCVKPLAAPAGHTFVLRGFRLSFLGTDVDKHIDRVAVFHQNGQLTVAFHDRDWSDDAFSASIEYAWVPNYLLATQGTRTGTANSDNRYIGVVEPLAGTVVVRGFDFDFTSSDHHLTVIGIEPFADGPVGVWYHDKWKDDAYRWRFDFATLAAPPLFQPVGGDVLDLTP